MSRSMKLTVAVLLIGCGEHPTLPDRSGSMSFTYHGALARSPSGTFSVQGGRNSWPMGAGGERLMDGMRIAGSRSQGSASEFSLFLAGTMAVGSLPMCDGPTPTATPCVSGGFFSPTTVTTYGFGWAQSGPQAEMRVTITEFTASRIRGTFEGAAWGYCAECGMLVADTATISAGVFDVPYR